ncbi:MAG TPA: molybdenum cofactor guanylyltransferase MobA, partial [Acetobacteraceae bacterium]|nr:molybdenum cofactor guanylyltransferase MobA [Acetobacteraceae bacterium]
PDFCSTPRPVGVLLAGGLARRIGGGDKGLRLLAGRTLLDHVVDRVSPQVDALILNANGDPARFAAWALPVVADPVPENPGPLAGILAGMLWAQTNHPAARDIVTVPTDTPFLPTDLVARLAAARAQAGTAIACAQSGDRVHPVVALWPLRLADDLRHALDEGTRKIMAWMERHGYAVATFQANGNDPFFNVNTPDDLAEAARRLG